MLWLAVGILLEVFGAVCLKFSDGAARLAPLAGVAVGYGAGFWCFARALRTLEVGTAYALWTSIATALLAIIGALFLNETMGPAKMGGIILVIGGVLLLSW